MIFRWIGSFTIFITDLQSNGKKNFTKDSFMELLLCQLYLVPGNDFRRFQRSKGPLGPWTTGSHSARGLMFSLVVTARWCLVRVSITHFAWTVSACPEFATPDRTLDRIRTRNGKGQFVYWSVDPCLGRFGPWFRHASVSSTQNNILKIFSNIWDYIYNRIENQKKCCSWSNSSNLWSFRKLWNWKNWSFSSSKLKFIHFIKNFLLGRLIRKIV